MYWNKQWKVTKERDGFYKFTQDKGAAIEVNKLLFLDSKVEDPYLTTWKVEHVPQHGDNAYMYVNSPSAIRPCILSSGNLLTWLLYFI